MNLHPLLAWPLIALAVTGCAFSRTTTPINYSPRYSQPLAAGDRNALAVGAFRDSRPVSDDKVLLHKANQYGTTSGAYVAERPVADLLRDGVIEALKKNEFTLSTSPKYELRGDLQEFGINSIAGLWTATVKPRMQVRFELVEKASGNPVWRDTYIGRGDIETAWGTAETVAKLFNLGTEDIIRQLVSDPSFRKFCQNQH